MQNNITKTLAVNITTGDTLIVNNVKFPVVNVHRYMVCNKCEFVRAIVIVPWAEDFRSILFDSENEVTIVGCMN